MPNQDNIVTAIQERMNTLNTSDICALFLLLAEEGEESVRKLDLSEAADHAADVLKRFFRKTDLVGYLGNNRFAAFLSGQLTARSIWEKASTLSEALWFASEAFPVGQLSCYVGVYLFGMEDSSAEAVFRKAEYALEMAKKEENRRFYICTESGLGVDGFRFAPEDVEGVNGATGLKELWLQYNEKREWLHFLARKTDCQLWEVDLPSRVFRMIHTSFSSQAEKKSAGWKMIYENFPESMVEAGWIHRDSADDFRAFGQELLNGKAGGSMNFMVQYRQTGCFGWAALTYHMLYDEDGHPIKAIGVKEDLSYVSSRKPGYIQRRPMPTALYPHLYCYIQADLTADEVEKLQLEGREQSSLLRYQSYSDIIKRGIHRIFSTEDAKRFQKRFDRSRLIEKYKAGESWLFDQCRVVDSEGSIQWISVGLNLARDPETGDICMFAYLSNRNLRSRWEGETKIAGAADPLTGVYDMETAERIVRHILNEGGQHMCAMAEIRIGGLDDILEDGSRRKRELVTALNVFLDTDCVIGQNNVESLFVFFPRPVSKDRLKRRLEDAFSFTRVSMGGMQEMLFLRFIAGIDCHDMEGASYGDMKRTAQRLCTLHCAEAEDGVFFSEQTEEHWWSDVELGERDTEKLDSQPLEHATILTEEDKDMALDCMGAMLKAKTTDSSIDGVLMRIGRYYQADRVYILMLTENKKIITSLNEWDGKGKYSIQQSISGKRTARFPVIERYAKNPGPVFLSMKEPLADGTGDKITWQYAILPMEKFRDAEQLLCIENPRRPVEQTALLDRLIPYISRERIRLLKKNDSSSPLDRLYALPNLQACMNTAYGLDSDLYSSLGALAVDIPDFGRVKEIKGYEYGSRFLLRLSEVLRDVFGGSLLFHTREAEFIVFCTNVTYEWFLNQCARVRQLMGRQYSGQCRVGCTWSDRLFRAADLMSKARSIMRCAGPSEFPMMNLQADAPKIGEILMDTGDGVREHGNLTIFLQPKVDMRSGELVGAEALARVLDDRGEFLPHGRMIQSMEKNGTIHELDYFVFDRMLDTMSRWQKRGYPVKLMSSNFSRNTLLSPSCLASVLAILSRYPDVSQENIELEITETAGDFENNTFSDMIQRFGEYGLRFSLDDFGSSYSNMSMLADLHFHSIKIDRSMIRNITVNQVSRTLVRDVIRICRDCGTACIAEGVETAAQANALLAAGGVYAQGYFYGRPMAVEEFERKYFTHEEEGARYGADKGGTHD